MLKFRELVLLAFHNKNLISVLAGEYPYTIEQS